MRHRCYGTSRWRWEDELTWIITASNHGCADDVSHVKRLQHVTVYAINFQNFGFALGGGIRRKGNPVLPVSIL